MDSICICAMNVLMKKRLSGLHHQSSLCALKSFKYLTVCSEKNKPVY